MFEKLRKRQKELEESPYPDELYGFEAEMIEFFMLVDGSLDYVLANKKDAPASAAFVGEKLF